MGELVDNKYANTYSQIFFHSRGQYNSKFNAVWKICKKTYSNLGYVLIHCIHIHTNIIVDKNIANFVAIGHRPFLIFKCIVEIKEQTRKPCILNGYNNNFSHQQLFQSILK